MVTTKVHSDVNEHAAVQTFGLNVYYGTKQAIKEVTLSLPKNRVTTLIGPSGCGKSTFLRSLNRMNDRIPNARVEGEVRIGDLDPYAHGTDLTQLRRTVGMVFQKANPFPTTIYENVTMAPRLHFGLAKAPLEELAETALRKAALWDEVKDDWRKKSGLELSGGQQQRLCIARMLAVNPQVILMDEPCSALDPISTHKIEQLTSELVRDHTVVVVTHNLQQAQRISHHTAFFMFGEVVESGPSEQMMFEPKEEATKDYLSGLFG